MPLVFPPGEELRRCWRYFERVKPGAPRATFAAGAALSATVGVGAMPYALKRAVPTFAFGGNIEVRHSGGANAATAFANDMGLTGVELVPTTSGMTIGSGLVIRDADGTGYMDFDADI